MHSGVLERGSDFSQLKCHSRLNFLFCFVSSGTTGRPKGVAVSHNALVVQSLAKLAVIGYNSSDVG